MDISIFVAKLSPTLTRVRRDYFFLPRQYSGFSPFTQLIGVYAGSEQGQ
ncbi:hypothetical protein HMPREF0281_01474 [Corynebacterium ammoniagenes DSM 20306]|uniref:Uncharacterized protein n=1 Tax=Corynebacterium ammoniagenes DSM 20306 TaxID=649754 RepID=A0ABP2IFA4_CORAM|nr:hypothetical protein HMPREF0281_01474 [Corynebacterium ammoniagenes DSM 20306]